MTVIIKESQEAQDLREITEDIIDRKGAINLAMVKPHLPSYYSFKAIKKALDYDEIRVVIESALYGSDEDYEYIVSYSDEYIGCVEESHKCFEDAKRELDALSEMKEDGLTILRAKVGGDYTDVLNNDQWIKFC
jgi:hypothetical protein